MKFKKQNLLNKNALMIIDTYKEIKKGLSPFMEDMAKKYLKDTCKIDIESYLKFKDVTDLEMNLKLDVKFCDNDIRTQILDFSKAILNEDELLIMLDSSIISRTSYSLNILKKIGFTVGKFSKFYNIDISKGKELQKKDFILNFVDLELRRVIKNEIKTWPIDIYKYITFSEVYILNNHTNFDLVIDVPDKVLTTDLLDDIKLFITMLNDFLNSEYGL